MPRESIFSSPIIPKDEISVDSEKIKVVIERLNPRSIIEVKSFGGLAEYYRKFVKIFSKNAGPMLEVLKKGSHFQWVDKHDKAFKELKKRLMTVTVLTILEWGKAFDVYYDA